MTTPDQPIARFTDRSLHALLAEVLGPDRQVRVSPLLGGLTNHSYRVETGSDVFVLRIAGDTTSLLGIDREREHACAVAAAAAGVGAEVIAFRPQQAALLTRFITGRVLSDTDPLEGDLLARVATALRQLHAGPTMPGIFSAPQVIRAYHALAIGHGVRLPTELSRLLAEDSLLPMAPLPADCRPCHNDLLSGNLIDDGRAVRIIDWEYAAMGDPFFDLGNFAEHHKLEASQEQELLRIYHGRAAPADLTRLRSMRRISSLREAMWGFAQAGISPMSYDFRAYAEGHWLRFLAAPGD
jgi:thiamine kinase-like enzyme